MEYLSTYLKLVETGLVEYLSETYLQCSWLESSFVFLAVWLASCLAYDCTDKVLEDNIGSIGKVGDLPHGTGCTVDSIQLVFERVEALLVHWLLLQS